MNHAVLVSKVTAVLTGDAKIEALNAIELDAFAERLPEAFLKPAPDLVAAYQALSDE